MLRNIETSILQSFHIFTLGFVKISFVRVSAQFIFVVKIRNF